MIRTALLALTLWSSSAHAQPVPFIGCPSDGQQGPEAPPRSGPHPNVAARAAPKLAYYGTSDDVAVLAPRGWHCFGTVGSNGVGIVVAPRLLDWTAVTSGIPLKGPAVTLQQTSGGTSGRFEVAEVAARIFPAARSFVVGVEAEHLTDNPFPRGPFSADRRTYRGPYKLFYTTAAGRAGLGTRARLGPDALPVDGVEWLHPEGDMDLTSLAVRLPKAQRALVADIIKQTTMPLR